ncbi:hypothetical protein [Streptomyces antibioticus]|uniref:hypothetical protein n=1 Tax=Streptomyces antibioticus TaxID=1890 RepID=UPI003698102D
MAISEWTYEGPVHLASVDNPTVHVVDAVLEVERAAGELVPGLLSWGGEARFPQGARAEMLDGRYDVMLPTGQQGAAHASTSARDEWGAFEVDVHLEGIGAAPWLPGVTGC